MKGVEILYKDLETLFDYIEPTDQNELCFSFRAYELLLRICTEVEANLKAILQSNGYEKSKLCMNDYWKVNLTHHLSSYKVHIPHWRGQEGIRMPFGIWSLDMRDYETIPWYKGYNTVKHNRMESFEEANLKNVVDAFCGLLVILSSQFCNNNFAMSQIAWSLGEIVLSDGLQSTIGAPFRIEFPGDWKDEEYYDFNWDEIKGDSDPYQKLSY
ncbi:MAG: hypothetical protein WBI82_01745 [Sphaerochaeta sp.]